VVGLAAVATIVAGACRQQPFDETHVDFFRNADAGCNPPNSVMDTYIVEMYEVKDETLRLQAVTGVPRRPMSIDCDQCIANPTLCGLEKRICICSGETPATPVDLQNSVTGAKFSSLERNDFYCLRVLGVQRNVVGGGAPMPCSDSCDAIWDNLTLSDQAQICAISQPNDVGPINFGMDVRCPSDGEFGGFGGGGRNSQNYFSFTQCIYPNPCDRPDAGAEGDACPGS
jgi:hypothetical protein